MQLLKLMGFHPPKLEMLTVQCCCFQIFITLNFTNFCLHIKSLDFFNWEVWCFLELWTHSLWFGQKDPTWHWWSQLGICLWRQRTKYHRVPFTLPFSKCWFIKVLKEYFYFGWQSTFHNDSKKRLEEGKMGENHIYSWVSSNKSLAFDTSLCV